MTESLAVEVDVVKAVLVGQFEDIRQVEHYHILAKLEILFLDLVSGFGVEEALGVQNSLYDCWIALRLPQICFDGALLVGLLFPCIAIPFPVASPATLFRSLSLAGNSLERDRHCGSRFDPVHCARTSMLRLHYSITMNS